MKRTTSVRIRARNQGFTLVELAIVGLFLGLLAVFAISQFSNSATENTRVHAYIEAARKTADNWAVLSHYCSLEPNIGFNDVTVAKASPGTTFDATKAANNLAYLLGFKTLGSGWDCAAMTGSRQLFGLAQGSAASMTVLGSTLTVDSAKTSSSTLGLKFANVPPSVSDDVTSKMGSSNMWVSGTDMTIIRPL